MKIFQAVRDFLHPSTVLDQDTVTALQKRTLKMVIRVMDLICVMGIMSSLMTAGGRLLDVVPGILALGLLITIDIFDKWPYSVRGTILLAVLYGFSVASLTNLGIGPAGILGLISLTVLGAVLGGTRTSAALTLISIVTLLLFGTGFSSIPTSQLPQPYPVGAFRSWGLAAMYLFCCAIALGIPVGNLISNLQSALSTQKRLSDELENERKNLENRVDLRTEDLQRRSRQIQTAAEITRSITSQLNLNEVMQNAVALITERAGLYYAGIFLVDENARFATLKAGSGEAGRSMITAGHRLEIGGASMIGWSIANRSPRIALDTGAESVRFNNPYLPHTRSEMAIPMISHGKAIGALSIQSNQPSAFDADDIVVYQGIADSLASAVENARLYEQTRKDLDEIRILNQQYIRGAWEQAKKVHGDLKSSFVNSNYSGTNKHAIKVPLILRDQNLGSITIQTENETLTAQEQSMVEAITTQTALALESARLLEESQRRIFQEERLNDITAGFSRAVSIEEVLRTTVREIGQISSIAEVAIHLIPPGDQTIHQLNNEISG